MTITLSPELLRHLEDAAVTASQDHSSRWRDYERVKAWLWFRVESTEEFDVALAYYREKAKL